MRINKEEYITKLPLNDKGYEVGYIQTGKLVRCRDCKHYISDGGALTMCETSGLIVDDDDYCSYGERKDT